LSTIIAEEKSLILNAKFNFSNFPIANSGVRSDKSTRTEQKFEYGKNMKAGFNDQFASICRT